jgi:hypothetical protein
MTQTFALAAVIVALVVGGVSIALAGVPTDTVRDYTDAVVKVLEDPALQAEERRRTARGREEDRHRHLRRPGDGAARAGAALAAAPRRSATSSSSSSRTFWSARTSTRSISSAVRS